MSLDHIGELPEVRRYYDDGKHNFMLHGACGIRYIRESIADAALAAVDREVERREMCGSCRLWNPHSDADDMYVCFSPGATFGPTKPGCPCRFTPSHWMGRGTP